MPEPARSETEGLKGLERFQGIVLAHDGFLAKGRVQRGLDALLSPKGMLGKASGKRPEPDPEAKYRRNWRRKKAKT